MCSLLVFQKVITSRTTSSRQCKNAFLGVFTIGGDGEATRLLASRAGFEKSEHAARSVASTARRLY